MQYIKLFLAVDDRDMEAEFKQYSSLIDRIANREKVEEQGFFFGVQEAKVFGGSAVVRASNIVTPTLSVTEAQKYNMETFIEQQKLNSQRIEEIIKNMKPSSTQVIEPQDKDTSATRYYKKLLTLNQ